MKKTSFIFYGLLMVLLGGCASRHVHTPVHSQGTSTTPQVNYKAEGLASWYGGKFHGRKTASGERFDKNDMTCAHRTLPFGTLVHVTNLANGNEVVVRVTDRGPAIKSRLIDVSQAAARKLDMIGTGTAKVRIVSGKESTPESRPALEAVINEAIDYE